MPYNLEEIQKQIDALRGKTPQLGQYTEAPTGFSFSEALRERLTQPEDMKNLIQRIAETRSQRFAIPTQVRAEAPIGAFSPTEVASLISERQQPLEVQEEVMRGIKTERTGRLEEIIGRATQGYEAQIEKQQTKYDQERQKLQDLIEERDYITKQQQYLTEQTEEKRRWEEQMKLGWAQETRLGGEGEDKEAIVDAFVNQVENEGLDLVNVPAEYRGGVAVKLAQTTEETTWSKEMIQGLKEEGNTDDEILAAAREDGMEEQVKKWLEELYGGGTGGQIGRTVLQSWKEAPSNIKWGLGQIKSWLTQDLGK